MMAVKKVRKVYPLLNVLRLMRVAKPLTARGALGYYTTPIRWLASLGRLSYRELLPPRLLLSTKHGLYYAHVGNIVTFLLFHEAYEIENIMSKLVGGDTVFVDVGAHVGLYTVWACRRARRIISVEPNPAALAYLKVNVALNECSNVTVVPKALSDRKGYAKLKIPKETGMELISGMSSIVRDFKEAFEVEVETDTLDSVLEEVGVDSVDILKIDVEGAEGLVVRGAEKTLKEAKAVLIEIWPENMWVARYLKNSGYKLAEIIGKGDSKNYLFIRR